MLHEQSTQKTPWKLTMLSEAILTHYTVLLGSVLEDIGERSFDKNHAKLIDV